MAKISSYSQITTPTNNDLLLGTDVGDENKTKNFPIKEVGSVLGLPQSVTVSIPSSTILTLAQVPVVLLNPVGVGKSISIESVYVQMNTGTTAYDFTQDLGVAIQNPNTYINRSFTLYKEMPNFAVASVTFAQKLEPSYSAPGVPVGQNLLDNGGMYLQGNPVGTNPTQGNGSMIVTAYYRLFDSATFVQTS